MMYTQATRTRIPSKRPLSGLKSGLRSEHASGVDPKIFKGELRTFCGYEINDLESLNCMS